MGHDEAASKIVMQVTITEDASPALYRALSRLSPRRRVTRLKDLARQGLFVDGGVAVVSQTPSQPTAPSVDTPPKAANGTVSAMLDWGGSDEG